MVALHVRLVAIVFVLVLTACITVHGFIDSGPQRTTCKCRTTNSCQLMLCIQEECAAETWLVKWLRATSGAGKQVGIVSPSQTAIAATTASSMTRNPAF